MNYKNQLQELCSKNRLACPVYEVEQSGPPHAPYFSCKLSISSRNWKSSGIHNTKKLAEQDAARIALESLKLETNHEINVVRNYKNELQEFLQKRGEPVPTFSGCVNDDRTWGSKITFSYKGERYTYKTDRGYAKIKTAENDLAGKVLNDIMNGALIQQKRPNQSNEREMTVSEVLNDNMNLNMNIPKTKADPSNYHVELWKEAMKQDIIICLPIGSQPFLIVCMKLLSHVKLYPKKYCVVFYDKTTSYRNENFILEYVKKQTGLSAVICKDKLESFMIQGYSVLLCDYETYIDDLNNPIFLNCVSLLIADDIHRYITDERFFRLKQLCKSLNVLGIMDSLSLVMTNPGAFKQFIEKMQLKIGIIPAGISGIESLQRFPSLVEIVATPEEERFIDNLKNMFKEDVRQRDDMIKKFLLFGQESVFGVLEDMETTHKKGSYDLMPLSSYKLSDSKTWRLIETLRQFSGKKGYVVMSNSEYFKYEEQLLSAGGWRDLVVMCGPQMTKNQFESFRNAPSGVALITETDFSGDYSHNISVDFVIYIDFFDIRNVLERVRTSLLYTDVRMILKSQAETVFISNFFRYETNLCKQKK